MTTMPTLRSFRPAVTLLAVMSVIAILIITVSSNSARSATAVGSVANHHPSRPVILKPGTGRSKEKHTTVHDIADANDYDPLQGPVPVSAQKLSQGGPIMPHLGNETIKAELGRASWKLLHTILARYPEKPTSEEREALSSYIYLFSRVYPCGECASHFQKLLKQFPPQTSSRIAASQWGCHIHNQVNARLGKEIFDCNLIAEKYECGCADDSPEGSAINAEEDDEGVKDSKLEKETTTEFVKTDDHLKGIHIESKDDFIRGG